MVNTINNQAKPISGDETQNSQSIEVSKTSKSPLSRLKYSCQLCNQQFRKLDSLDRHLFKHTGEKAYSCDVDGCDKKYSNRSHLNRHKKTSHSVVQTEAVIICHHAGCHQIFTNQSNANRHYQAQHGNNYSHTCLDCGESFRRKMQLKRHTIISHTGKFPNVCTHCGKGFLNIKSLNNHRRSHKILECSSCSQTFDKWSQLVKHRRDVHRSQKPNFICDHCDKTFCRKPNIKEHMKIHSSSEVAFVCHYENCSKFYSALRNLNAHIRSKHEGKAGWTCDFCNQQLSSKQRLLQHLKAHLDPSRRAKLSVYRKLSFMRLVPSTYQDKMFKSKIVVEVETSCTELSDC